MNPTKTLPQRRTHGRRDADCSPARQRPHRRPPAPPLAVTSELGDLEEHRRDLMAYCNRMLGSPFEAQDAVQETMLRAWRSRERFEGRSTLRSWLFRIARNVCFDMLSSRRRRARPIDLKPERSTEAAVIEVLPDVIWTGAIPDPPVAGEDPAEVVARRETLRLAFASALEHLPPRQRAVLILREALHWRASEVANLLGTSVQAVNSALQRARATLEEAAIDAVVSTAVVEPSDRQLLARYIEAFEHHDIEALTSLIHEDAT